MPFPLRASPARVPRVLPVLSQVYTKLMEYQTALERHYRDMQVGG